MVLGTTSFSQDFGDILDECLTYIQVFAAVWRIHGHDKNWAEENTCTSILWSPGSLSSEKRSENTKIASRNLPPWHAQPSNFGFGTSQDLISCTSKKNQVCTQSSSSNLLKTSPTSAEVSRVTFTDISCYVPASCDRAFALRPLCPPCCIFSRLDLSSRTLSQIALRLKPLGASGLSSVQCNVGGCRHWHSWHLVLKVLLRSECQRSDFHLCLGVIKCFGDHHRIKLFLWFPSQSFSCAQDAHLLSSLQFSFSWKDHPSACQYSHASPFGQPPIYKRSLLAGAPVLKKIPVRIPLCKEFRRGVLDCGEPLPFSLLSRSFSGLWFIPHLLISSRALNCWCPLFTISAVYWAFAIRLPPLFAASVPEQGFSSCLSREKKCCSRTFCSNSISMESSDSEQHNEGSLGTRGTGGARTNNRAPEEEIGKYLSSSVRPVVPSRDCALEYPFHTNTCWQPITLFLSSSIKLFMNPPINMFLIARVLLISQILFGVLLAELLRLFQKSSFFLFTLIFFSLCALWCRLLLRRLVSLPWRISLVGFDYFFWCSHYFHVVLLKLLCTFLRVMPIFRGLLLCWSMFCWFGCCFQ